MLTPGFAFSGIVTANAYGSNTLELGSAASAGTLSGLGTTILHFGAIVFDPGADWSVAGLAAAFAGPINGFDAGDTIELSGITATGSSYAGGVLTVNAAGGDVTLNLPGSVSIDDFRVTNVAGGVDVALACFAAGTCIRTPGGAMAVEALAVGDMVLRADGTPAPVTWLGHRRIDCRRHARPHDVLPVRISAGAFGAGLPERELVLSPDHAVFVAGDAEGGAPGVLIPVRYLVNGRTIRQEAAGVVTYWHVELPEHGVLLAEGLPCESYLDTGNRGAFADGGAAVMLHADFARGVWARDACAELVLGGARLAAARRRLLETAAAAGHAMTHDPRLLVVVDGKAVPVAVDGRTRRVRLPAGTRSVRLVSRRWVPVHMRPEEEDARCLGVAISGLRLDGRAVALDDAMLGDGWHDAEPDWRWTDGDAGLAVGDGRYLAFDVAMTGSYWRGGRQRAARDGWPGIQAGGSRHGEDGDARQAGTAASPARSR